MAQIRLEDLDHDNGEAEKYQKMQHVAQGDDSQDEDEHFEVVKIKLNSHQNDHKSRHTPQNFYHGEHKHYADHWQMEDPEQ